MRILASGSVSSEMAEPVFSRGLRYRRWAILCHSPSLLTQKVVAVPTMSAIIFFPFLGPARVRDTSGGNVHLWVQVHRTHPCRRGNVHCSAAFSLDA